MCVSCGCQRYDDDHGDPRNITMRTLNEAGTAANVPMSQVFGNIAQASGNREMAGAGQQSGQPRAGQQQSSGGQQGGQAAHPDREQGRQAAYQQGNERMQSGGQAEGATNPGGLPDARP